MFRKNSRIMRRTRPRSLTSPSGVSFIYPVVFFFTVLLFTSMLVGIGPVLASDPEQAAQHCFLLGKSALDEGNAAKAEESWKPILGDSLYGPVSYLLLARGYARERSFSKSESLIRDFLKLYPSSPYREASLEDLTDYVYLQRKPEATKLLLESIPNASESRKQNILLRLGDMETRSGDFNKALVFYRKLYLNYPAGAEGLQARERISRLVFNGKIRKPEFTETELLSRASKLSSAGRHDMASNVYRGLLNKKPTDYLLALKYARSLYKDRKNNEAIKSLSELLTKPISAETRVEAIYIMSLVYWRIDKDPEFESCCAKILEKGASNFKTRALVNLAAFNYEKGHLSRADTYYNRLLSESSDPSIKGKIKWRVAWIKYRSRQYNEAAVNFREIREFSKDPQMARASKYWEARATTLAGKFEKALPLYRDLAENYRYDYYGSRAQTILISAKQPVTRNVQAQRKPFPDLRITPALRSNALVLNALKLIRMDLPEFALLNLQALSKNIRSTYPIIFLMAKAAQQSGYYGLAHEIVVSGFSGFVDNPPDDAPREFVELAYPRVHMAETSEHATRGGVDPFLVWAVVRQESRYDAYAVSPAGALGLMQVTPRTASAVTKRTASPNTQVVQELLDPKKNLSVGIQVLADNLRQFKGNVVPAIAAYNADINKVRQWIVRNGRMKQDEFIENIPYSETRLYVKKVLTNLAAYSKIYARKDLAGYW